MHASVHFVHAMPVAAREPMEEIASTVNPVAKVFGGDVLKTATWFEERNPLFGDVVRTTSLRIFGFVVR